MREIRYPTLHDPARRKRLLGLGGLAVLLLAGLGSWALWPTSAPETPEASVAAPTVASAEAKPTLAGIPEAAAPMGAEDGPAPRSTPAAKPAAPEREARPGDAVPSYAELVAGKNRPHDGSDIPSGRTPDGEVHGMLQKGETLAGSLLHAGLDAPTQKAVSAALKGVLDFKKCRPGNTWDAKFNIKGELVAFTYHLKVLESYYVRKEGTGYRGYRITGETEMFVVPVAGVIESNLSNAMYKLGETDTLTQLIADIFAWDIDFFSDLQKGDEFRVLVEKHYYQGKFVRYGRILCASFSGAEIGKKYAYYFSVQNGDGERQEYFDDKGNSLAKTFLRAPLDTLRVTSSFGFRMHPTLGEEKMHNGVDYGAPMGTPTWAIAQGKVLEAGWMGACGNGIKIRHDSGYEAVYCHLSSISVHSGEAVRQKQLVGRVGTTGRSTGPHLHFGLMKDGKYVDPQKVKYEPGKPVPGVARDRFREARLLLKGKLDGIPSVRFYGPPKPPGWVDPTPPKAVAKAEAPLEEPEAPAPKAEKAAPKAAPVMAAKAAKPAAKPGKALAAPANKKRVSPFVNNAPTRAPMNKRRYPRPQGIHRAY